MKRLMSVARSVIYSVLLIIAGCVADPELENVNSSKGTSSTRAQSEGKFYYAFEEKVPLYEVPGRMVVTFDKEHRFNMEERIMHNSRISKEKFQIREGYFTDYALITINDDSDKKVLRDDLSKQTGLKSIRQVYAIEDGYEMGYTNEIIMQFKQGASQQKIDEMHKRFSVEVVKTSELYVLLSVPVEFDPLDVANAYQESGLVVYSHPNFITSTVSYQNLPTDPYFDNQFYLHNTGQGVNDRSSTAGADINIVPAWAITKGSPHIVVAVIDYDGFTPNHPDMPNMLSGRNFGSGGANNYFASGNNNHGNACAGIIGAVHNNGQGIAGIAPNCMILPVKISSTGASYWVDAIKFAADNADVISCSCGIPDAWGYLSTDPDLHPTVVDAIRYATTSNRRGNKGSVIVFAPSNSADHRLGINGSIYFPSNVNIPGVLTVGATDRNDRQANYSPTSALRSTQNQIIDVVAPSHKAYSSQIPTETFDVWSIDIPGYNGYNPTRYDPYNPSDAYYYYGSGVYLPDYGINNEAYTGLFGGTSAAAPQVAGVAALVLSVNPALTQKQVADVIEKTARKINYYSIDARRPNGFWNQPTGYGVVNAHEALKSATSDYLAISGDDYPIINTNVPYNILPTPLPLGVNFDEWTVTGGAYTTIGGLTTPSLMIKFTEKVQYTLTAKFTLPDGTDYPVSKILDLTIPPPPTNIMFSPDVARPNSYITFMADYITPPGVTYEWVVYNGGRQDNNRPTYDNLFWAITNVSNYPFIFEVRCRAWRCGSFSDWTAVRVPVNP